MQKGSGEKRSKRNGKKQGQQKRPKRALHIVTHTGQKLEEVIDHPIQPQAEVTKLMAESYQAKANKPTKKNSHLTDGGKSGERID